MPSRCDGRITNPTGSLAHATKWAAEGVAESLVFELGELGIRAKLVEPGAIAPGFGG